MTMTMGSTVVSFRSVRWTAAGANGTQLAAMATAFAAANSDEQLSVCEAIDSTSNMVLAQFLAAQVAAGTVTGLLPPQYQPTGNGVPVPLAVTYPGAWSSTTPYVPSEIVSYAGTAYLAIVGSTGVLPTNTAYWVAMGKVVIAGTGPGISVAAFGAKGDGVTDDTAAIQAALNSLQVVYFPSPSCLISSALTVKSNQLLIGNNSNTTWIVQSSTSSDCFAGVDISYFSMMDIQPYGPGSGSGIGIHLTRSANPNTAKIDLKRVVVYNFGSDGINISNPIVSTFENVSSINNGGHGWNLYGVTAGAAGTSCAFSGCYGLANKQAGYRLYKMVYSGFLGCAAESNGINWLVDTCEGLTFVAPGSETPVNNSTSYPGVPWKITGSSAISVVTPWMLGNIGTGLWVTGGSTGVQLTGPQETAPNGATNSIQVDSGCKVTLIDPQVVTAMSLASGTTSVLHDASGNAELSGALTANGSVTAYLPGSTAELIAKDSGGVNVAQLYHTGAGGYGTLESTTGVVLLSDSGETTMTGPTSPQARVQHQGGSYHEMNFGHDDTNGKIATNAGQLLLAPATSVGLPQYPTASAPPYVKGGAYFDTTLNKLRIGGATAWETVTSS